MVLSYLFLENNGKDGIRTNILQKFLTIFRDQGLQPKFFLTDKDFAQINATRFTWPNAKVQLCRWHIKKAITTRLSSNKISDPLVSILFQNLEKDFPLMEFNKQHNFVLKNFENHYGK